MKKKKVFLDIDGVLADFSHHFINYYDEVEDKTSPITVWNDQRIVKYFYLTKNDIDFWLSIPPLINPSEINFQVDGYCTNRKGFVPSGVTEQWLLENNFPTAPVFLSNGSKAQILHEQGADIFLDDAVHNFIQLNKFGIKTCLLDSSYNREFKTRLRVNSVREFGAFANPSILIIGNKRHGKDTVAEMMRELAGFSFSDSSTAASRLFIFDTLKEKYGYKTPHECWEDRVNHRAEWFELICEYNEEDPTKLAKGILSEYDMYVGMRSQIELDGCNGLGLFDLIIGVHDERKELEDKGSLTIDVMKESHIVIQNNETLEELEDKVRALLLRIM